jgi:D-proline reductase (dithiol) PrdB
MEILENREAWLATFKEGWLAHYQQTGEFDWKLYNRPTNHLIPAGPGIELDQARLILISTAGGYLKGEQQPFDAADPLGDYTIRSFPSTSKFEELEFSHDHYNHEAVDEDPQVLLPLRHLEDLVREGVIGELCTSVVSLMGYMPVATRLVDETIPAILDAATAGEATAALLVPA